MVEVISTYSGEIDHDDELSEAEGKYHVRHTQAGVQSPRLDDLVDVRGHVEELSEIRGQEVRGAQSDNSVLR